MDNMEIKRGKTPAGGDYSIAYFFDEDGKPAEKAGASNIRICEFKDDGTLIKETLGRIRGGTK